MDRIGIRQLQRYALIEDAIDLNIDNPKPLGGKRQWGTWCLDKNNTHLDYAVVYGSGKVGCEYFISLKEVKAIRTAGDPNRLDSVQGWARHLSNKVWTTDKQLVDLVDALCTLFYAGLCAGKEVTV